MSWVCLVHQKGMRLLFEGLALENVRATETGVEQQQMAYFPSPG